MKKSLRLFGLSLALVACLSLFGHADCHCIQSASTASCNLCHSAVYTLPESHVPAPVFQAQEATPKAAYQGYEPSIIAVNLTRGPPSAR